jgi:hypothetical protein
VGVLGSVYVAVRLYAPGEGEQGSGDGKKEVFFFEKKNQKTLVCLAPRQATGVTTPAPRAQAQKFFGSFFQKRTLLPSAGRRLGAA